MRKIILCGIVVLFCFVWTSCSTPLDRDMQEGMPDEESPVENVDTSVDWCNGLLEAGFTQLAPGEYEYVDKGAGLTTYVMTEKSDMVDGEEREYVCFVELDEDNHRSDTYHSVVPYQENMYTSVAEYQAGEELAICYHYDLLESEITYIKIGGEDVTEQMYSDAVLEDAELTYIKLDNYFQDTFGMEVDEVLAVAENQNILTQNGFDTYRDGRYIYQDSESGLIIEVVGRRDIQRAGVIQPTIFIRDEAGSETYVEIHPDESRYTMYAYDDNMELHSIIFDYEKDEMVGIFDPYGNERRYIIDGDDLEDVYAFYQELIRGKYHIDTLLFERYGLTFAEAVAEADNNGLK